MTKEKPATQQVIIKQERKTKYITEEESRQQLHEMLDYLTEKKVEELMTDDPVLAKLVKKCGIVNFQIMNMLKMAQDPNGNLFNPSEYIKLLEMIDRKLYGGQQTIEATNLIQNLPPQLSQEKIREVIEEIRTIELPIDNDD